MKIDIEFKGLEELVKAFESAASDEDICLLYTSPSPRD